MKKVEVKTLSGTEIKRENLGIGNDCYFKSVAHALRFLHARYGKPTFRDDRQLHWAIDDDNDVFATFEDSTFKVGDKVRSNNNFSSYRFENGTIVYSYWVQYYRYHRVQLQDGLIKEFRTCDLIQEL